MAQQQAGQAGLADMDDVAARVARHLRRPAQEARHIARRKAAHRQQGVGDWWPDAGPIGFKDRSHQFDAMIASGHIGEQEGATDRIMRHVPGYDAHPVGSFGQGRLVQRGATGMDGQGRDRQCPRSIGEIHRQQQRTTIDAPRRGKIANDSRSRYKSDRPLHQRLVQHSLPLRVDAQQHHPFEDRHTVPALGRCAECQGIIRLRLIRLVRQLLPDAQPGRAVMERHRHPTGPVALQRRG